MEAADFANLSSQTIIWSGFNHLILPSSYLQAQKNASLNSQRFPKQSIKLIRVGVTTTTAVGVAPLVVQAVEPNEASGHGPFVSAV